MLECAPLDYTLAMATCAPGIGALLSRNFKREKGL